VNGSDRGEKVEGHGALLTCNVSLFNSVENSFNSGAVTKYLTSPITQLMTCLAVAVTRLVTWLAVVLDRTDTC
jgi:hypothetical protein